MKPGDYSRAVVVTVTADRPDLGVCAGDKLAIIDDAATLIRDIPRATLRRLVGPNGPTPMHIAELDAWLTRLSGPPHGWLQ